MVTFKDSDPLMEPLMMGMTAFKDSDPLIEPMHWTYDSRTPAPGVEVSEHGTFALKVLRIA